MFILFCYYLHENTISRVRVAAIRCAENEEMWCYGRLFDDSTHLVHRVFYRRYFNEYFRISKLA